MISTTIKKVSLRIRKQYFDEIVVGKKKVELRKYTPFWYHRLIINHPEIAVFVCGKRVHRRYITGIHWGSSEKILGRKLSKQGMKDVGFTCIAIYLGDEYIDNGGD